jgi:hypothetical protein
VRTASIIRDDDGGSTSETSVDNHFTRQYNPEDNSEHQIIELTDAIKPKAEVMPFPHCGQIVSTVSVGLQDCNAVWTPRYQRFEGTHCLRLQGYDHPKRWYLS